VHAVDDTQKSALHHAARRGPRPRSNSDASDAQPTYSCQDADIVQMLLANGAQMDSLDHNGCTPLMIAVANGHVAVVEALVGAQADLNAMDHEGNCALGYAVHFGRDYIAELLTAAGAVLVHESTGIDDFEAEDAAVAAVEEWNDRHRDRSVRVGDQIVEVNGVRGNAKAIMEECKRPGPLKLRVVRPFSSWLCEGG